MLPASAICLLEFQSCVRLSFSFVVGSLAFARFSSSLVFGQVQFCFLDNDHHHNNDEMAMEIDSDNNDIDIDFNFDRIGALLRYEWNFCFKISLIESKFNRT